MESEKGGEEVSLLLLAHSPYKHMNMIQKHKSAGEFGVYDGGFVQIVHSRVSKKTLNYSYDGGGSVK